MAAEEQTLKEKRPKKRKGRLNQLLRSSLVWVGLVVLGLILWSVTAYPRGVQMAYIDHARGHREVKVYGGPLVRGSRSSASC